MLAHDTNSQYIPWGDGKQNKTQQQRDTGFCEINAHPGVESRRVAPAPRSQCCVSAGATGVFSSCEINAHFPLSLLCGGAGQH